MKHVMTADWHLGLTSNSWTEENGRDSKTNEIVRLGKGIVEYCVKAGARLKHAGDWFESKRPTPEMYDLSIEILNDLEEAGIQTDIVKGNHESSNSRKDALEPIRKIGYKNIRIWNRGIEAVDEGGWRWIFCPHQTRRSLGLGFGDDQDEAFQAKLKEAIEDLASKAPEGHLVNLVGHFQHVGAVVGSESSLLGGGVNLFPEIRAGLIYRMFLGHVHKRQELRSVGVRKRAGYIGGLTVVNFGERSEEKGFEVWDDEADEIEFIPVKARKYVQVEIDLASKASADMGKIAAQIPPDSAIKMVVALNGKTARTADLGGMAGELSKAGHVVEVERNIERGKAGEKAEKADLSPEQATRRWIEGNVKEKSRPGALRTCLSILSGVMEGKKGGAR